MSVIKDRRGAPWRGGPWLRALLVLIFVILLDQVAKRAVRHSIIPGEERKFLPGVQLVNTRNHGVAFGFLPGDQTAVTILIGLALLALLAYFAHHATRPWMWLPTGMLLGGALGNILDRFREGSVTDFIKLPLGWPPFNLADASITLGILILFLIIDGARRGQDSQGAENPRSAEGSRRAEASQGTEASRRAEASQGGEPRET